MHLTTPHDLLIRQIETVSRLTPVDREMLRSLMFRARTIEPNTDIARDGQAMAECCLVLSGVVCRYKIVAAGRRQIVSFHFAGDMPDLNLYLERTDHSLGALTAAKVAFVTKESVRALCARSPAIAAVFHRQALVDGSIFREWIANIGRRLALERVSHLICECFTRMRMVGLAEGNSFKLPITQAEMGDATGLSSIHINRTMQSLRRAGLVKSEGKLHTICDWQRMVEAADFDANYLHLLEAPSAPTV